MTTRDKQDSVNDRRKSTKKNNGNRDLELLMSLIDPTVADSLADAANRGVGYVELNPEAEKKILKNVMKKINEPPVSA